MNLIEKLVFVSTLTLHWETVKYSVINSFWNIQFTNVKFQGIGYFLYVFLAK